jgi:Zn-finger nucleic acid-binding protein
MSAVQYCPVCPTPSQLRTLDPHLLRLPLKRCDTCLGVLADPTTVAVAATYYHSVHYVMSEGHGRHHCRHCDALFDRVLQRCRTCLKEQALTCVGCLMPMQVIEVAGVSLDVCRPCRMVWFDRGELGLLTRRHSAELQRNLHPDPAGFPTVTVIDVVAQSSDGIVLAAELAAHGADVAVRAVSDVSASKTVEVVAAVGEGATELAAGAIDMLVSVLGDVF